MKTRKIGRCFCPFHRGLNRWLKIAVLHRTPSMHVNFPEDLWLCKRGQEDYLQSMKEQWDAYYSGLL